MFENNVFVISADVQEEKSRVVGISNIDLGLTTSELHNTVSHRTRVGRRDKRQ